MQGHRDLPAVAELIMDELTPLVAAQYGAFFLAEETAEHSGAKVLRLIASYGYQPGRRRPRRASRSASRWSARRPDRQPIVVDDVPADYVRHLLRLGRAAPAST